MRASALSVAARRALSTAAPPAAAPAAAAASSVTLSMLEHGIALVRIDVPGEKVNTLSRRVVADFVPILARLETDASIRGAVVISGKESDFIAGADISMLAACSSAAELTELSVGGQGMMDRVEALGRRKPLVAAIHGNCLGGGLELALACTYRIASRSTKTKLGLPEVKLGLLPGSGGTKRLPALVGVQEALAMMTAGGNVRPEKAAKTGLVNEVVEPAALQRVAALAARELADGTLKATRKPRSWLAWALEGNPLGLHLLFDQARKRIDAATGGKYAAPVAILDTVRTTVTSGPAAGAAAEAAAFGRLGMTDTSKALRGLFFSDTATRKHLASYTGGSSRGGAISTLGIVGAGLMGAGVAQVSAMAGLRVVLKDRAAAAVARGEKQVGDGLGALVKRKRLTAFEAARASSVVYGVSEEGSAGGGAAHLARCQGVVEAVFEDLTVKHAVIAALEGVLAPSALIATNTSAIPIASIAAPARHPERILGLHYFSPVDKMPLAEVIPHAGTSPAAIGAAIGLAQKQGKTVILVRDVPGFYVNRCLGPYMTEGMALCVGGGVEPPALDAALKAFGWPVGPVTLMDEVGVDVAFHTFSTLQGALGNRMGGGCPEALADLLAAKQLGRKSGAGFFLYPPEPKGGKKGSSSSSKAKEANPVAAGILAKHRERLGVKAGGAGVSVEDMQQRMLLRFIKECILCAQDDILAPGSRESNPKLAYATGDIGAVFGIGFPPFLVSGRDGWRGAGGGGGLACSPLRSHHRRTLTHAHSCRAAPSATVTLWGRRRWRTLCSAMQTRWGSTLRLPSSCWTWPRAARRFIEGGEGGEGQRLGEGTGWS